MEEKKISAGTTALLEIVPSEGHLRQAAPQGALSSSGLHQRVHLPTHPHTHHQLPGEHEGWELGDWGEPWPRKVIPRRRDPSVCRTHLLEEGCPPPPSPLNQAGWVIGEEWPAGWGVAC